MSRLILLLIFLTAPRIWANPDDHKKPIVNMVMEAPEVYKVIKAALNRTFLKHDHTGDGSGVFIGNNRENLGLVLTAAHVARKSADGRIRAIIPEIDGIPRSPTHPESAISLRDFFFGRLSTDSQKGHQRIGVPYYTPELDLVQPGEENVGYIADDYALALVGQVVASGKTVTELFSNPEKSNIGPELPPLKIAAPVAGESLVIVGGLNRYDAEKLWVAYLKEDKEELLKELPKFKAYYSVTKVADYDKAWLATSPHVANAPYDPSMEFFMEGDVADGGMSGSGVYNMKGELVGLVIQGTFDKETKSEVQWVRVIRADYVFNSILAKSKNPEVLQSLKDTGLSLSCSTYLTP